MKRHKKLIIILLSLLVSLIVIIAFSQQFFTSSDALDYKTLIKKLQATGTTAIPVGSISQPFMSVQGRLIGIQGEQIQVYEYSTVSDTNSQATNISSDGSTFATKSFNGLFTSYSTVDWVKPPHFYKQGRIIVLYIGMNSTVMQLLTKVVDKQFAGRAS